jgi:hypothetical protein
MVSFAQRQLEKYGWKPGQGLGAEGQGRVDPVIPQAKNDTVGVRAIVYAY